MKGGSAARGHRQARMKGDTNNHNIYIYIYIYIHIHIYIYIYNCPTKSFWCLILFSKRGPLSSTNFTPPWPLRNRKVSTRVRTKTCRILACREADLVWPTSLLKTLVMLAQPPAKLRRGEKSPGSEGPPPKVSPLRNPRGK